MTFFQRNKPLKFYNTAQIQGHYGLAGGQEVQRLCELYGTERH